MYKDLYHHGIEGQKWGVRNGPPYPLESGSETKKRKGLLSYVKKRKEQKRQKTEEKERKEQEARKAKLASKKEEVLRKGNATQVMEYFNDLTTDEIRNVVNRLEWEKKLVDIAKKEASQSSNWNKMNSIMKKVGDVKEWAKISVELAKVIEEGSRIVQRNQRRVT